MDVPHGLPVQGMPTELTIGGMPRTSDHEDGDAVTFSALACPGHRGNFGGGNPPPPKVPPMRRAGELFYNEQKAPCHWTMCQGSGAERERRRLAEEELRESTERAFRSYGEPLEHVTAFRYLGRVMTAVDDYWTTVVGKLQRERKSWGRLLRILSREWADMKVSGYFSR